MLPDSNGFDVSERLHALRVAPQVVLISSHQASDFGRRLRGAAALGFISKPELSGDRLRALLREAS